MTNITLTVHYDNNTFKVKVLIIRHKIITFYDKFQNNFKNNYF